MRDEAADQRLRRLEPEPRHPDRRAAHPERDGGEHRPEQQGRREPRQEEQARQRPGGDDEARPQENGAGQRAARIRRGGWHGILSVWKTRPVAIRESSPCRDRRPPPPAAGGAALRAAHAGGRRRRGRPGPRAGVAGAPGERDGAARPRRPEAAADREAGRIGPGRGGEGRQQGIAGARRHHRAQGLEAGGVTSARRPGAAGRHRLVAQAIALVEEQEVGSGEIAGERRRPVREGVLGRAGEQERFVEERRDRQSDLGTGSEMSAASVRPARRASRISAVRPSLNAKARCGKASRRPRNTRGNR